MYYETNCTMITCDKWDKLMKGARPCSYKKLVRRIKKELPDFYKDLALEYPNPYDTECRQTKTHYILVHSAIEYFIHK